MSDFNDGGPAFPTENARQTGPNAWHHEGMTLRDYFAGKALLGGLSSESVGYEVICDADSGITREQIHARMAYRFADAMIAKATGQEEAK